MNLMIKEIREFAAQGATFVVSHSGGKDSQALLLHIAQLVPVEQIAVIHVDMKGFEWAGTEAHMRHTAMQCGIPADRIFVRSAAKSIARLPLAIAWLSFSARKSWCAPSLPLARLSWACRSLTETIAMFAT
jgi:3'-phosphoadenosine 5'-phosphosulfate sulfotransferase (PAPS reductase)/FAD synthetase